MLNSLNDMKPCPFCGSLGVTVVGSSVRCGSCGAAGPYGVSDAEAVTRWNERRSITPADRKGPDEPTAWQRTEEQD